MDRDESELIRDLFDELDEAERGDLHRRLEADPLSRQRQDRYRALIGRYRAAGEEEPPTVDLDRLLRSEGPSVVQRWRRGGWLIAAQVLITVAAFLGGRMTLEEPESGRSTEQVRQLGEEVADLRRELAFMALRQDGAAARIAAIEDLASLGRDPAVAAALWERLGDDPSANVRLAAVDALYADPDLAPPSEVLARLIIHEPDPLLRLALLDWLSAARRPGWRDILRAVTASDASPEVRARADELLEERS